MCALILSAKYRSGLIISVFIGMICSSSLLAADVTNWEELKNAINNAESGATINIKNDIKNNNEDIVINKELTIDGQYYTLSGNDHKGLTVKTDGNLILLNTSMQNFNNSTTTGGAIYNTGGQASIAGNFTSNRAKTQGGAIYNTGGEITSIVGDFNSNVANSAGGAISNQNQGKIKNLTGNFIKNSAGNLGGAVVNSTNSTITFVAEDNKNIEFNGNYVTNKNGKGGAVFNNKEAIVGLYADAGHTITFIGGADDDTNNKYDIDGIYNAGTLNINGDGETETTYTGTVNLYNVTGDGYTYVNKGTVIANGNFAQNLLQINNAKMEVNNTLDVVNVYLGQAVLKLSKATVEHTQSQQNDERPSLSLEDNSTLNLQNNSVGILHIKDLDLYNTNYLMIDADLANARMDQIDVAGGYASGDIIISDIHLLSDSKQDILALDLFAITSEPKEVIKDLFKYNVKGSLSGLKYSPLYAYNADYDENDGKIIFTRTEQINPYLYTPSVVANTTAAMTTQIAALAMDKMDDVVHVLGRSDSDTVSSNTWLKVMGLDDNVEFKNFESINSKALTVAGGFNTDKITYGNSSAVFGAYAGYIGGKQQYTSNDIDQNGGYVGLSSALTLENAFLIATVNGGLLNNKSTNMYGTDEFRTLWLGTGLKTGYNYAITDSVVLQPNVYGGYTLVNTQDYTSASGVKLATHNLNFFEIDPGLKLSTTIADGWIGSVQGKYAIVMNNGGDITANDIVLTNISPKNYIEYGLGIDKSLTDAFYMGVKINRHDGGRTGWNGSIEFRYNF